MQMQWNAEVSRGPVTVMGCPAASPREPSPFTVPPLEKISYKKNLFHYFKTAIIFVFIIFFPLTIYAKTAMKTLLSQLEPLQRMQADFSQKTMADGKTIQSAKGEMAVSRPGKFYWHLQGLSDQIIVADGHSIWVYDKDLAQVTVQDMETLQADVPGLLLAGSPDYIESRYTAELIASAKSDQAIFKLIPRESQSLFQYALLTFQGNKPLSLSFIDSLDQTTELFFSNVRINRDLPADLFHFEPPKGADIIRQQS
ncbi:MAG: lolA [Gammaproteobacteria bacterium]|nr:lolA [Gammaproteobacteria bacterium]